MSIAERAQPGILKPPPLVARSLTFRIDSPGKLRETLRGFADEFRSDCAIVGFGEPCTLSLGPNVPGLCTFPAMSGAALAVPSTQDALWVRLCGPDRGVVFDDSRTVRELLSAACRVSDTLDTFVYHGGRDLTRFEDGTENPKDDDAVAAAIVQSGPVAGSSFVAVQVWVHDLSRFEAHTPKERDLIIGREAESNEEIEDAPDSAHVKRTAQEDYDPPAFMVRRSMPWAGVDKEGLEFVSFVDNLEKFTRMMQRMCGREDGIVDGLFKFSRPVSGGFYWCPPVNDGKLDLGFLLDE